MTLMKWPDPGTAEAASWGCTCPKDQLAHGADPSRRAFAVTPGCPVHELLARVARDAYAAASGSDEDRMRAAGLAVAEWFKAKGGFVAKTMPHAAGCYCPMCDPPSKA